MLRNLTRLSVSSRIGSPLRPIQASTGAATALRRGSIASFHKVIHPAVNGTTLGGAAPLSATLPPTVGSSQGSRNDAGATPSTPVNAAKTESEEGSEAGTMDQQGEEVEEREERDASTFAEFVPVSPEQARSLDDNPILKQLVNTIMKDGKKARAQRFVADALLEIRSRTHSDPYQVVLDAVDLASPILRLTPMKKGSKILQVPTPMTERQRRRKAIVWILEASDKRKGENKFKDRLASEFLAVVNGNSGALVKKSQQHKMALANRANASLKY
ncbi:hypothetical protein BGX34_009249 [Mortierella sp. NVP85]|nr:hypothetical protein BGX34_009249 [Mortierella sp. NVP85]